MNKEQLINELDKIAKARVQARGVKPSYGDPLQSYLVSELIDMYEEDEDNMPLELEEAYNELIGKYNAYISTEYF